MFCFVMVPYFIREYGTLSLDLMVMFFFGGGIRLSMQLFKEKPKFEYISLMVSELNTVILRNLSRPNVTAHCYFICIWLMRQNLIG